MKLFTALAFLISSLSLVFLSFFNYKIPSLLVWFTLALVGAVFVFYISHKNLISYALKRFIGVVALLFVISSLVFVMLRALPGGPFDEDRALPPEVEKNIRDKYSLDAPLYQQYWMYIKKLVQGDMGASFKYLEQDVSDILGDTMPVSVQLGLYALILSYLLGIPLGLLSAVKHNTLWDRLAMITAISGIALPSFLVAPLAILFFGFYLGWFEVALWEGPAYYVLPVLVLGTRPASVIARLTRSSVLEVLSSDYVRTAKAKGLHPFVILYKHVLKNSFLPVLTFSGPLIAGLLTGSFIIEQIFAIPGMGKHLILSVTNRDYPLVLGATLVYCLILVLANLIVDLLYSYFDPRIRLS
ncbi:MAG: ABC transporter permease [Bdellovibrionales bacterium]|nr:ABC transporter permease [Bdellovibrionales bacterium]